MWLKWLPWRFFIRRIAQKRGFIDPVELLSRVHRFAEPSEVAEPMELLRAGVVFHARGLINTKAVQHNLDWVWPYWIEKQFDPKDTSFIPRAFSITHVNLTHRNWTAIGLPGLDEMPIVDPMGLLTPFWDSWSIDVWIIGEDGSELIPSREGRATQTLEITEHASVLTKFEKEPFTLETKSYVEKENNKAICQLDIKARSNEDAWLVVSLRPCNPEGVSFVHNVKLSSDQQSWIVDGKEKIRFSKKMEKSFFSNYNEGDVYLETKDDMDSETSSSCNVGMATAAAKFSLKPDAATNLRVTIPLRTKLSKDRDTSWAKAYGDLTEVYLPDEKLCEVFRASVYSLILLSPEKVYPGPFTYKRFWFRDAVFILEALSRIGMADHVGRILDTFPAQQKRNGYFCSQEGEWDSNGQVLWLYGQICKRFDYLPSEEWINALIKGGDWILKKRVLDKKETPHQGLMPAGFSAEHFGPNDYYYWDDFWSVAGLISAAGVLKLMGEFEAANRFIEGAKALNEAIEKSFLVLKVDPGKEGIPASPYRRMDSGAIGSIVSGYPLCLWQKDDPRLLATVNTLVEKCFTDDAFFQDMIHSGVNPYLTLHVAQVMLRAGDQRWEKLLQRVIELASPTGQWPEAIHPSTQGGCMGDGHHGWASAEFVQFVLNCFVQEEKDKLIVGAGIKESWLKSGEKLSIGPVSTLFGLVHVEIVVDGNIARVICNGQWIDDQPTIEVHLPGRERKYMTYGENYTEVSL